MIGHRLRPPALALLLVVVGLGLGGCARATDATAPQPAQVVPIPGTGLHRVTLTQGAMQDLGVQSQPVRTTATGRPATLAAMKPGTTAAVKTAAANVKPGALRNSSRALTVIPLTAVIYDPQGRSWTYVVTAPRSFIREAIVIDHTVGAKVFLRAGPPAGTPVVTLGAPELLGAEYGVGEE